MGRRKIPGLFLRGGVYYIDKRIRGRRVCEGTGTDRLAEAEAYLARLMEKERQADVYGVRPTRLFEEAAIKFVEENQHKRTIKDDIRLLTHWMPFIGNVPLHLIHMETLKPWIAEKRKQGRRVATINNGLQIVRH